MVSMQKVLETSMLTMQISGEGRYLKKLFALPLLKSEPEPFSAWWRDCTFVWGSGAVRGKCRSLLEVFTWVWFTWEGFQKPTVSVSPRTEVAT